MGFGKPENFSSEEAARTQNENSQEQNKIFEKFSKAKQFIKNAVVGNREKGNEEEALLWENIQMELDCGNGIIAMQDLERAGILDEDMSPWREAIFEISTDSKEKSYFLNNEEIGKILHETFIERQSEINTKLETDPESYTEQDIKTWDKDVLRWLDASNEVMYNGYSENTLILLEEAIEYGVDRDQALRGQLVEAMKTKDNSKGINNCKEEIISNSKKLNEYRRMRDSLIAIKSKK